MGFHLFNRQSQKRPQKTKKRSGGAFQDAPTRIEVLGRHYPVVVRQNKQAKRLILRFDPLKDHVLITVPPGVGGLKIHSFLDHSYPWLRSQIQQKGAKVPFAIGQQIPLRGQWVQITATTGLQRVWQEGAKIHVSAPETKVAARVTDWLKQQAREEFSILAQEKAIRIGKQPQRISVRDTRSRWGSCSGRGNLSFSWRIIMAPDFVRDYLVAHEVAHLVHMNHSLDFWNLCAELLAPGGTVAQAERWLKDQGRNLFLYGAE